MSEAMTNREIEDVLTSIRRLVAQEGPRAEAGRLILTEELRVSAAVSMAAGLLDPKSAVAVDGTEASALESHSEHAEAEPAVANPVLAPVTASLPEPDFGKLEATIAELEAAVSATGQGWEPEAGPADAPQSSNVTDLYGRLSFVHRSNEPDPAASSTGLEASAKTGVSETEVAAAAVEGSPDLADRVIASLEPADVVPEVDDAAYADGFDDEPIDADLIEDESVMDEDMLRALVAQIVREELHGQLGERVTQQVRKLVRTEIAKALDDRSYL